MLALLALVAAIVGAAGGDGRQPIREGARVRVLMEDAAARIATLGKAPLLGRVVSVESESATVETSRGAVVIPFKNITRLELRDRGLLGAPAEA